MYDKLFLLVFTAFLQVPDDNLNSKKCKHYSLNGWKPVTMSQSQITKMGPEPICCDIAKAIAITITQWERFHLVPYNLFSQHCNRKCNRNRSVGKDPYSDNTSVLEINFFAIFVTSVEACNYCKN